MSHAIRIRSFGGPQVLQWEPFDPGQPGRGEVLVRHTAIGLNYIDVYERSGLYPNALPTGLGREGAGAVLAVGRGVRGLAVGDRVAYVSVQPGAYAQQRCLPADRLVRIPEGVSDRLDTLTAYNAQPTRGGYHFRLDESCTEAEKGQWREWCRRFPKHWPGHIRDYIQRVRQK